MPDRYVPSAEMVQTLLNIQTEIRGGMRIEPASDFERGFNGGARRASAIIATYLNGTGSFQITAASVEHRKGGPHA